MQICLVFLNGILDGFFGVLDNFFDIPKLLLRFALDLFLQTLRLLFLVSHNFSSFLLNFAGDIFDGALDLVFIDDGFSYG